MILLVKIANYINLNGKKQKTCKKNGPQQQLTPFSFVQHYPVYLIGT